MRQVRTVSVGLSRLFRIVEVEHEDKQLGYRVEQAVKELSPLGTGRSYWEWKPLAFATSWGEGHGALHQMQQDWMDKMIERQGSFRADKPI